MSCPVRFLFLRKTGSREREFAEIEPPQAVAFELAQVVTQASWAERQPVPTSAMQRRVSRLALLQIASLFLAATLHGQVPSSSYKVETVRGPRGIKHEVASIDFAPDGKLYAAFRRGYIYSFDPKSETWRKFAEGLHTPLGIMAGDKNELFVAQVPELTRVVDTDDDGTADLFETITDGWGLSGNYHEYIAGPIRDPEGNFYISLGLASGNADPREPVRGELSRQPRVAPAPVEGKVNKISHYSPVPYRGCALKIDAKSGTVSTFACGFRQPNGLVMSPQGDIFAVDNQGGWVGTSPLHHVTENAFHGHPASLPWHPDFLGADPIEADVAELDARRKRPAILFPQNDMGGSTAQPLFDLTDGAFGPYAGQLFLAEWTYPRIYRVFFEKVQGEWQGAAFPFIDGNGLRMANNRLAFSPDGKALYVAQTSRIWGSTEGLQRVVFQDRVPFDILSMELTDTGFDLTFTKPVDRDSAGQVLNYSFTHYYYLYHSTYGSPKTDVTPIRVVSAEVSADGLRVSLALDKLVAGRVFDLRPSDIVSAEGEQLVTAMAAYTLNRLR